MVRYQEPVGPLPRILGWGVLLLGAVLVALGLWVAVPAYRGMNSHAWDALAKVVGGAAIAIVGAGCMLGSTALFRVK